MTRRRRPSASALAGALACSDLEPEQRAAGIMLADAIQCCQSGDATACRWLQERAEAYVAALAGENTEQWLEHLEPLVENVQLTMPLASI